MEPPEATEDPEVIEEGVNNVKHIRSDNFVRPDEAQKILSVLRQRGSYTVIGKITVNLNIKKDCYEAEFSKLGLKNIPIDDAYPAKYDRLLCGGIWCIVQLDYEYMEEDRNGTPISIWKLTSIQMPHVDIDELKRGRKAFTRDEWMDVLLRSIGVEPDMLSYFRLGTNLNQRDTIAVRKLVGGLMKLIYPDGEFTKKRLEEF